LVYFYVEKSANSKSHVKESLLWWETEPCNAIGDGWHKQIFGGRLQGCFSENSGDLYCKTPDAVQPRAVSETSPLGITLFGESHMWASIEHLHLLQRTRSSRIPSPEKLSPD